MDFSAYPNPASDYFPLKLNSEVEYNLEIISLTGRLIKTYKNASVEIQVRSDDLTQGVDLINIYNQSTNQSEGEDIIIK